MGRFQKKQGNNIIINNINNNKQNNIIINKINWAVKSVIII